MDSRAFFLKFGGVRPPAPYFSRGPRAQRGGRARDGGELSRAMRKSEPAAAEDCRTPAGNEVGVRPSPGAAAWESPRRLETTRDEE